MGTIRDMVMRQVDDLDIAELFDIVELVKGIVGQVDVLDGEQHIWANIVYFVDAGDALAKKTKPSAADLVSLGPERRERMFIIGLVIVLDHVG